MKAINPVERTIVCKKKLIQRLRKEILNVRRDAEKQVAKIEFRIMLATQLLSALERGRPKCAAKKAK